jgi:DNA-binding transcriptional MocR family regulator
LDQKLIRLHQQSSQVANHISYKVSLTSEQSSEYYGSWLYQAIHAAVAVPELKTIPKLAARFRCDKMRVSRVIQRLSEMGLVETDPKGKWRATHNHTHLDRDSPNFSHHHRNWRLRSCHDEVQNSPDSLLYSGTYALSEKAAATIKALLLESLKDAHDQVLASKEEKVYALAIDWYEV